MTTFTTQDRQDAQRTSSAKPMTRTEWLDWLAVATQKIFDGPALTDGAITEIAKQFDGVWDGAVDYKGFARAIERAHGIGE